MDVKVQIYGKSLHHMSISFIIEKQIDQIHLFPENQEQISAINRMQLCSNGTPL